MFNICKISGIKTSVGLYVYILDIEVYLYKLLYTLYMTISLQDQLK